MIPTPLPLGDDGLLPATAFAEPASHDAYLVFSQQTDVRMDVEAWDRQGKQLWGVRVQLTRRKRYVEPLPRTDGAHLVLSSPGEPPCTRTVLVRPRREGDLLDAANAVAGAGLLDLARRCKTVVLVLAEPDALDRGALRVAALLSSVLLGPILSPDKKSLLGARSARDLLGRWSPAGGGKEG